MADVTKSNLSTGNEKSYQDIWALTNYGLTRGFRYMALAVPPVYVAFVLLRRGKNHLSVTRVMNSTLTGAGFGVIGHGTYSLYQAVSLDPSDLKTKISQFKENPGYKREYDLASLGLFAGGISAPILFWSRSTLRTLIFGGASMGSGAGLLAYLVATAMENRGSDKSEPPKETRKEDS